MIDARSAIPPSLGPGQPFIPKRWRLPTALGTALFLLVGTVFFTVRALNAQHAPPPAPGELPHIEGRRIVFPTSYAQRIGLTTVPAHTGRLVPSLSVVGTVSLDPEYVARIGTRLRGLVSEVRHFEGDQVKKGTVLADMDSPELGEAQAQVAVLKAHADAASINARREQELTERRLSTQRESEVATAAQREYQAMLAAAQQKVLALAGKRQNGTATLGVHVLTSPIDGTIVERHVARGQLVEGDYTAFLIADLDHLWIELAVFEKHLPAIRKDDVVEIHALGSKESILGRVAHIAAVIESATRSADIRVEVDNRERKLRPGQAVEAMIRTTGAAVENGVLIDTRSLTYVDGQPTVFVADSPTSVVATPVELGATDGQQQHVLRGLTDGQLIVTQGTFELKSELFR